MAGCVRATSFQPIREVNGRNFELIAEYWQRGFRRSGRREPRRASSFGMSRSDEIEDFLTRFECHSDFAGQQSDVVSYLERIANKVPVCRCAAYLAAGLRAMSLTAEKSSTCRWRGSTTARLAVE